MSHYHSFVIELCFCHSILWIAPHVKLIRKLASVSRIIMKSLSDGPWLKQWFGSQWTIPLLTSWLGEQGWLIANTKTENLWTNDHLIKTINLSTMNTQEKLIFENDDFHVIRLFSRDSNLKRSDPGYLRVAVHSSTHPSTFEISILHLLHLSHGHCNFTAWKPWVLSHRKIKIDVLPTKHQTSSATSEVSFALTQKGRPVCHMRLISSSDQVWLNIARQTKRREGDHSHLDVMWNLTQSPIPLWVGISPQTPLFHFDSQSSIFLDLCEDNPEMRVVNFPDHDGSKFQICCTPQIPQLSCLEYQSMSVTLKQKSWHVSNEALLRVKVQTHFNRYSSFPLVIRNHPSGGKGLFRSIRVVAFWLNRHLFHMILYSSSSHSIVTRYHIWI